MKWCMKYRCVWTTLRLYLKPHPYLKEYFADYAPILPSLFSLNHTPNASKPLYGSSPNAWDQKALDRSVQGIIALLLSLKKKPVIRYEKSSPMAKKLGVEIQVHNLHKFSRTTAELVPSSIEYKQNHHCSISVAPKCRHCCSYWTAETTR